MHRSLITALIALCLSVASHAHGIPKPKHGGLVDTGSEVSFELVRTPRGVTVHVEDHGKPMPTAGASAQVLLGSETGKVLARLTPGAGNTLQGPVIPWRSGDRLFVRVTFGNGSIEVGEIRVP